MYDIIIIGAGPAGLSAAIYGARAMKKVLVLDGNNYGGQIINSSMVENYPGVLSTDGFNFVTTLYNQAKNFGAEFISQNVQEMLDNNTVKTSKDVYRGKVVIIATGLKQRKLGLYGEKELLGKGISYCATCDGNFYKDKCVAVIGSGATALEDALYLSNIAKHVIIINRGLNFKSDELMKKNVEEKKNIEIIYEKSIMRLNGEEKLESITLNDDTTLNVDGLFIAIGYMPDNEIFKNFVDIDENGFIISDDTKTKTKNIFVAGDTRRKQVRQLITATSDGAISATNAVNYLNNLWLF